MVTTHVDAPTVEAIRANRKRLGDLVVTTPIRLLVDDALAAAVGETTRVWLKEELFQRTGSFKPRGALSVMLDLDADALSRGVTGVSAGNHAISLGYCARALGTTATVVMPKNANPFRVQVCRELGATVVLVDDVHDAFERVKEIESAEGAAGSDDHGIQRVAGQADEPDDRCVRGRAGGRRRPQPKLQGRLAAGDRSRSHNRRLARLDGQTVGLVVCGANIDPETFTKHIGHPQLVV